MVGAYRGDFQDTVTLYVDSDRAGLALEPGAMVKRHGVAIGSVRQVSLTGSGAQITLAIERDAARLIPADTDIAIASTTVFGGKNVEVIDPPRPSSATVADGATTAASSVSVELDTVFSTLTGVLSVVEPDKLNQILGAAATALDGNGAALGTSLGDLEAVLSMLNDRLPTLEQMSRSTATAARVYAGASEDILATLQNLTLTANTIREKTDGIDDLLSGVIGLSDRGNAVLAPNSEDMVQAVALLTPTATLLQRYSPVITCFLKGADVARVEAEKVSGGNGTTMLLNSTFLLGTDAYTYPKDLPKVAATGGPRCGALPTVTLADVPTPYVVADTGANPFDPDRTSPALAPQTMLEFMLGGSGAGR